MEAKHTPGPWFKGCHCGVGREEIHQILANDKRDDDIDPTWVVADVNCCMGKESTANALLIAAAPELLAALEVMLQAPSLDLDSDPHRAAAIAAIRKAKGE
jgi:hypothetical protein